MPKNKVIHIAQIALLVAFVIIFCVGSLVVAASSPIRYEYLNTGGDGDSAIIHGSNWTAMQFTTGTSAHTITSIRLDLKRTGTAPGTVTVSIREADAAHKPTGSDISAGTLDGDDFTTSYTWYEFTIGEASLENSTEYTIVLRAESGNATNNIQWHKDTGGGLADAVGFYSTDSGITWTSDTPIDYLFEIWGNPSIEIENCAVFGGFVETGDLLFVGEVTNTYHPYFPLSDPSQYFDVQLYATDNTTLIASTVLKDWGKRPVSIYLSADEAASLEEGSAYYMKLVGAFGSNPTALYQLKSSDWRGSNLAYLDNWVILTARSMEDYYDRDLTTYIVTRGYVLNEEGGVHFANGIPGLSIIRPDIFQAVVNVPLYELPTWTNAFQSAEQWEALAGTRVVNMTTDVGTVFGVSSEGMACFGLLVLWAVIAFFLISAGNTMAAAVVGVPIILFGAYLRVIDIVTIGVILAGLALVIVWHFWWSRT